MHETSWEKIRAFRDSYLTGTGPGKPPCRVLEVGSMSQFGQETFGALFSPPEFSYIGMDMEEGPNVDLAVADPYCWTELEAETFDVVISGSSFEHNPYFWITMAEIGRVLIPGGLVAIVVPSAGGFHRHPYDCWRFRPDSGPALCEYVGMELLEYFVEERRPESKVDGFQWHDSFLVGRRPVIEDDAGRKEYDDRLASIVATRAALPEVGPRAMPGPAITTYEQRMATRVPVTRWTPMRSALTLAVYRARGRLRTLRRHPQDRPPR